MKAGKANFDQASRGLWTGSRPYLMVGVPTAFVVLYSLVVLWFVATTGDTGIRGVFGPRVRELVDSRWSVEPRTVSTDMQGVTNPGEWSGQPPRAGKSGDILTMLGGYVIENYTDFIRASRHVRGHIGEYVEARWVRDGVPFYGHVLVARPPLTSYLWSVFWFLQEMVIFAIGARVLWRRPRERSARVFFALCVVTVVAYMGGYHWSQIAAEPTLIFPFAAIVVFVPIVSLHFYLIFPRALPFYDRHRRAVLGGLYALPCMTAAALWISMSWSRWGQDERLVDVSMQVLRAVSLGYIAVASVTFLICLICLMLSYQRSRVASERDQVRWLLIATILSIPPIGWLLWDALIDPARLGMSRSAWPMSVVSLLYTVAYAFSITRYKLMQTEVLLNRGVLYVVVSMAAGLLYSGGLVVCALVVGERMLGTQASLGTIVACVTAIVLLILSGAARSRFQSAIDRSFYREKYKFDQAMRKMSVAVESLVDRSVLGKRLLEAASDVLRAEWGTLYLREASDGHFQLAANVGPEPDEHRLSSDNALVARLQAVPIPVKVPHAMSLASASEAATDAMIKLGGEVATPLESQGRLGGVLLLGPKRSGLPYEEEELAFLRALGSVAILALHSADTQQTLEALNQNLREKVEKISEQQRRIVFLQQELSTRRIAVRELEQDPGPEMPDPAPSEPEEPLAEPHQLVPVVPAVPAPVDRGAFSIIKGSSAAISELIEVSRKVAHSPAAVLIRGESGTGKELLAEAIHKASPRAARPFVKVHCAALSQTLLESELFGHVKGAFTDAKSERVGRFQKADGGSLFLDEIGDINFEVQTKLLRVLQEMSFEKVGSSQTIQVDVRIIAATHQDLESLMRTGRFREDLYYRLNVITLRTPALRERREDLFELALHFLLHFARRLGKNVAHLEEPAIEAILAYSWPGNIRELENAIERAVVLSEGTSIRAEDLPDEVVSAATTPQSAWPPASTPPSGRRPARRSSATGSAGPRLSGSAVALLAPSRATDRPTVPPPSEDLDTELLAYERQRLIDALHDANGNKSEAARLLRMPRSTFFSRLRKHGLA